jgi:hypothetical protein
VYVGPGTPFTDVAQARCVPDPSKSAGVPTAPAGLLTLDFPLPASVGKIPGKGNVVEYSADVPQANVSKSFQTRATGSGHITVEDICSQPSVSVRT